MAPGPTRSRHQLHAVNMHVQPAIVAGCDLYKSMKRIEGL